MCRCEVEGDETDGAADITIHHKGIARRLCDLIGTSLRMKLHQYLHTLA